MRKKAGRVIGVIAVKGGVGKTTTVSNMGIILSSEYDIHCVVVDANISVPNLALHLNIFDPPTTLQDALSDTGSSLSEAVYVHESGLHIIPGSLSKTGVDPEMLAERIHLLAAKYDIVLIDSSPGTGDEIRAVVKASDELLIVSSLDFPTVSSALKAIKLANSLEREVSGIVLNKVKKSGHELNKGDIESLLNVPVLEMIPEDAKVPEALSFNMPVVLYAPTSPASNGYRRLSARIIGDAYGNDVSGGFFERLLSLFGIRR